MSTVANARQHGETSKAPDVLFAEERHLPLNPNPFDPATIYTPRSGRTCRVRFDANTYSVPAQYARQALTLKAYPERLLILHGERILAEHPRCYLPIDKAGADLLFQVLAGRYEKASTILTTNRAYKQWPEIFNHDATLTAALLDRLLHHVDKV